MKNISIVYKRPKKNDKQLHDGQKADVRRYVDQYFTKMVNRNSVDEQNINQRSKTARITSKMPNKIRNFTSLSIATIKAPSPILSPTKTKSQRIIKKNLVFNVQKLKKNDQFAIKLPQRINNTDNTNNLLTRESLRPKDILRHSKVNCLGKIKCTKSVTIIISADFIINQLTFWNEDSIQLNSVKGWRILSQHANIIWLVRRQCTAKKLQDFAQNYHLRVDGFLQLQPHKKQPLTVSYHIFEQQAKLSPKQTIIIINSLRIKQTTNNNIDCFQFKHSLPILKHQPVFIHFIKNDITNDRNRFNGIMKIVSCELLPEKFDVMSILERYGEEKYRGNQIMGGCKKGGFYQLAVEFMENLKSGLYLYFDDNVGMNTKIEGDSMYYLIGDMIKRNYGIAKQYLKYTEQYKRYANKNQQRSERDSSFSPAKTSGFSKMRIQSFSPNKTAYSRKRIKIDYQDPIYIWDF